MEKKVLFILLILKFVSTILSVEVVEEDEEIESNVVELFSSLEELSQLAGKQKYAIEYMTDYLNKENETYNDALKVIAEFEHLAEVAYPNPKQFVGNPVNSFILIKYYYYDLNRFFLKFNFTENLNVIEKKIRSKVDLPNEDDYKGSARALLRLQDMYLLSPSEMSNGVFWSSKSFRPLNAFECEEIGRIAQNNTNHKNAIKWFHLALSKYELEGGDDKALVENNLIESIAFSTFQLGRVKEAIELVKDALNKDPNNTKLLEALNAYKKRILEEISSNIDEIIETDNLNLTNIFNSYAEMHEHSYAYDRTNYEALCRNDEASVVRKPLSCRYITYNPLLVIAPIKEEQVYDDPPIWVYHDVITQKQADRMIDTVKSSLNRAMVSTPGTTGTVEDIRISKLNWVGDWYDPMFHQITKLTSAITNMTMRNPGEAEYWQINNYGLGGLYDPHFDNIARPENWGEYEQYYGLRIATWMFYIEAPEVGGATVFPELGARISPTSRSAVFWYNVLPSGEIDRRSLHAGCPVFIGSKWVSNKWIRSHAQMFHRKCNLVKDEIDPKHYIKTDPWFFD